MTKVPPHLLRWLRAEARFRKRWCGFPFRRPAAFRLFEQMQRRRK